MVVPEQTGELLVMKGDVGLGLIVTLTFPVGPTHPFLVTKTEYVPALVSATLLIVVFCWDAEYPFGPDHEYIPEATASEAKFRFPFSQIGELEVGLTAGGIVFTTTFTLPAKLTQPLKVLVTE